MNQPAEEITPSPQAKNADGLPYVVIRSSDSGAHIGYLKSREGSTVSLVQARRLWYWSGAASLSQLALEGVKRPQECKFPAPVNLCVLGVCEVIEATEVARKSIQEVEPWAE